MVSGHLRIVAGRFRGRRIRVPSGDEVRPTADRVREALFSILGGELPGLDVLDAYAGSGALGLEALSRGARRATFIESSPRVLRVLRDNVSSLGLEDRCRILPGRVERVLAGSGPGGTYDLVLADPPYAEDPVEALLASLLECGCLAPEARIAVEREGSASPHEPSSNGVERYRSERYGRVRLDLFRRIRTSHPS